ncbi:hypothetical protein JTE90_025660 [Oedothorax gibbosus]|uniref:DUF5641 domain-containing protein n=1 Tax=Oedothorax gibbosus TaxID=931172 RepID=A0AAV6TL32_9ARAC|nr:hypothetical protein JTE90_025660 [Oedothorax gibbosus]
MTSGIEASSQTNRPIKDGCSQTEQTGSRVLSTGAPKSFKSHAGASTPAAKPKLNKGQKKSKGKKHQPPLCRSGSWDQRSGGRCTAPKVTSLDQDRPPTPQTLAEPESQGERPEGNQATKPQADAPQVEIPHHSKRTDFAITSDSERSFAEVVGSGPSCPRGPKKVKSTAPSSTGRHPVTPETVVKKTWPYIWEALVVGPLGNTPSSKLPFRSFMWNLLETNGLGKPAYDHMDIWTHDHHRGSRYKRKSFRPLKEGDIVLIGDDNKKRVLWPLGLVIEARPGADGIVRRVKLKTQQGELYRAVQRLYHLEVSSKEDWAGTKTVNSDIPSVPFETLKEDIPCVPLETVIKVPVTTRSGRMVKVPNKLSL